MSVLASGSTGNATYVESEKGSLLVDVGLTGKKMEDLFSQIDRDIKCNFTVPVGPLRCLAIIISISPLSSLD